MKKRNMPAILLLVCILLTLLCSAAVAETKTGVVVDGQTYTIETEANTAVLTSGVIKNKTITVPDTITVSGGGTYSVIGIETGAYTVSDKSSMTIELGKNLQYIRSKAFAFTNSTVKKITFYGALCQNIATDAFSGINFEYWDIGFLYCESNVLVYGKEDCMEEALADVEGLKYFTGITGDKEDGNYYTAISYKYEPESPAAESLQIKINNAPDNVETIIYINEDIEVIKKISVPAGKNIVLKDDGKERKIYATLSSDYFKGKVFEVEAGATLTIDGSQLTIKGEQVNGSNKIIDVYGKLYLKNGTLTGGETNGNVSGSVVVNGGAEFHMSGGTIQQAWGHDVLNAAVVVCPGAYFNMTGGKIDNNHYTGSSVDTGVIPSAGGVLLYTWSKGDKTARMDLSGTAVISNNDTNMSGGGIFMVGDCELNMTGGTITGNSANQAGGGVCVVGANSADIETTKFTMTGGTISNNKSKYSSGGGIYVNSQYVTLKGGYITGNTAAVHGGGIYVSTTPYTVHLENALITGNRATTMGGGLWLCPQGYAEVHVTNGGAIYDNVAKPADPEEGEEEKPITDAAADDIASIWWIAGEGKGLTLAERMLGGGKIDYYNDGVIGWSQTVSSQFAANETGKVVEGSQRFDPANPGAPLSSKTNNTDNLALISVASDGAKALAEKNAKLVISGNTAPRGGGIGSNGGVIIGEEDETTYSLIIKKDWGNTAQSLWQEVTLQLVIDGNKLDEVQLNSGNEWMAKLEGFALEDLQGHKVTLEEKNAPAGFKLSVSELTYDKEKRTFAITATNVYAPEVPNKPEIEIPKTGDSSHIGLMLAAMAASLLGLLACALAGKRRGNR